MIRGELAHRVTGLRDLVTRFDVFPSHDIELIAFLDGLMQLVIHCAASICTRLLGRMRGPRMVL